jgi:hypothetical protein
MRLLQAEMGCCNDSRVQKEKPFPVIWSVLAALLIIVGGGFLLLG